MKRYIRSTTLVTSKEYIRFDNRLFQIGDTIQPVFRKHFDTDIVEAYFSLNPEINDIEKILYLTDSNTTENFSGKKYKYVVDPNVAIQRFHAYSPWLLNEEFLSDGIFNEFNEPEFKEEKKKICEGFAKAYSGDNRFMEILQILYGYTVDKSIEYISNFAKVLDMHLNN